MRNFLTLAVLVGSFNSFAAESMNFSCELKLKDNDVNSYIYSVDKEERKLIKKFKSPTLNINKSLAIGMNEVVELDIARFIPIVSSRVKIGDSKPSLKYTNAFDIIAFNENLSVLEGHQGVAMSKREIKTKIKLELLHKLDGRYHIAISGNNFFPSYQEYRSDSMSAKLAFSAKKQIFKSKNKVKSKVTDQVLDINCKIGKGKVIAESSNSDSLTNSILGTVVEPSAGVIVE